MLGSSIVFENKQSQQTTKKDLGLAEGTMMMGQNLCKPNFWVQIDKTSAEWMEFLGEIVDKEMFWFI